MEFYAKELKEVGNLAFEAILRFSAYLSIFILSSQMNLGTEY